MTGRTRGIAYAMQAVDRGLTTGSMTICTLDIEINGDPVIVHRIRIMVTLMTTSAGQHPIVRSQQGRQTSAQRLESRGGMAGITAGSGVMDSGNIFGMAVMTESIRGNLGRVVEIGLETKSMGMTSCAVSAGQPAPIAMVLIIDCSGILIIGSAVILEMFRLGMADLTHPVIGGVTIGKGVCAAVLEQLHFLNAGVRGNYLRLDAGGIEHREGVTDFCHPRIKICGYRDRSCGITGYRILIGDPTGIRDQDFADKGVLRPTGPGPGQGLGADSGQDAGCQINIRRVGSYLLLMMRPVTNPAFRGAIGAEGPGRSL